MSGRALLSRLAGRDSTPVDPIQSVGEHLRVLLNTRRGDSVSAPEFGILDFADVVHEFPGGVHQLAKSIRATIMQYEPRLRSVGVRHVPDENQLTLRFEITAQLLTGRSGRTLRFATTVRPGGHVDVSG